MTSAKAKTVEKTTNKPAGKKTHSTLSRSVVIRPRASEKAYAQSEQNNVYVFQIDDDANSHDITKAVAAQYGVSVTGVRIAKTPGKSIKSYRRQGRVVHKGQRSGVRKAYVTLKEGDKLPIFAAIENTNPNPDKDGK